MEEVACTYRISVKAIITDDNNKIALIREKDGRWELPGGGLEHGEEPRDALAREIAEETGMTVTWMGDAPEAFWSIRKDVGSPMLKWFAFVAYAAKVDGTFTPTSDEGEEMAYFSKEEAVALPLHDNTQPYFTSQLVA